MKLLTVFALFALLVAPLAMAQTQAPIAVPNADVRAQVLKDQIEGFLENQKLMAAKNNCKLETLGEVTVEQGQGYYAITLPSITYTDAKGIRSEIGMIAINASPDTEDDGWKISLALPTPINSYDTTGAAIARTDIGTQNASGLWNERLGHFTSVNARFGNVQINDLVHQNTVTVGELAFFSSMEEQDEGMWTGSAQATLSNISHFNSASTVKVAVPKIAFSTNVSDRASKYVLNKEEIKNRPQRDGFPDVYNIFSQLFGAPEEVKGVITGLNPVMTQLQQATITAKPEQRQDILAAALGVTAINGVGKPVAGDPDSRLYNVRFQNDGKVMVNDMDITSLIKPDKALLNPKTKKAAIPSAAKKAEPVKP